MRLNNNMMMMMRDDGEKKKGKGTENVECILIRCSLLTKVKVSN